MISDFRKIVKKGYDILWNNNCFKKHFFDTKTMTIPGMEICYSQECEHYPSNGLLIVGLNPSGTDKGFYTKIKRKDVFFYTNSKNPYISSCSKFALSCGYDNNFYMLDIFGIIQADQNILINDLENNPYYYQLMFEVFAEAVKKLKPEVILFANAFVSKLVAPYLMGNNIPKTKKENYLRVTKTSIIDVYEANSFGGYVVLFNNGLKTKAFFSSMLSGKRALDIGSKKSLIWLIRNSKRINNNFI